MAIDPIKRKASRERYARRLKIQKYGEAFADIDMRGKHKNHASGAKHGKWNSDKKMLSSHGYVLVRVGSSHPMAFGNGYAYEHDLVMVSAIGRLLRPGEHVHHIDDSDKTDNRLENLEIKTNSEHRRLHALRQPKKNGKWVTKFPS